MVRTCNHNVTYLYMDTPSLILGNKVEANFTHRTKFMGQNFISHLQVEKHFRTHHLIAKSDRIGSELHTLNRETHLMYSGDEFLN